MSGFPGSSTGTSSFGTLHFWLVQGQGRALPRRGKKLIYSRTPIPYSDDAVTQISGKDLPPSQRQILLKPADWNALLALLGTRATLTMLGESAIAALLVEVGDGADYAEGVITTTVTFEY
jgi:hypothetical protein